MAEMYNTVYLKDGDSARHKLLGSLFRHCMSDEYKGSESDDFKNVFCQTAAKINTDSGEQTANDFLDELHDKHREALYLEDLDTQAGYHVVSWMTGGSGDRALGSLIKFLYRLCPTVHAQGVGMGDDDPWEYWFKYENDRLVRFDDEPFDDSDQYIYDTVYRWWHADMPDSIREGMLNDDEDGELEVSLESSISEEDYQSWLQNNQPASQDEQDADELATEMVADGMMSLLGGLFSGLTGNSKESMHRNAIEADVLSQQVVEAVFADIEEAEKSYDMKGVMKHLAKDFKIDMTIFNATSPVSVGRTLYRMGLAIVFRKELEYENQNQVKSIEILNEGSTARAVVDARTFYIDPEKKTKTVSESTTEYVLESIDGMALITSAQSTETLNQAVGH